MNNNKYDVIIVGAGPTGIFASYEFTLKSPHAKVLLIDKGLDVFKRRCPILEKKLRKCPPSTEKKDYAGCLPACSITSGFGGAGAYSDGKFNITTEFGGWMTEYLDNEKVLELIRYVDEINLKHGATDTITDPTTDKIKEIEEAGKQAGLKLLRAQVRHLGTEQNLEILKNIYDYLQDRIEMKFRTEVTELIVDHNEIKGLTTGKGETFYSDHVIIAPGRDGSVWLSNLLKKYGQGMINNQVDIGVRVETADEVMHEINKHLYEGKFHYKTDYGTIVRTFCSNPSGHVVVENHSGIMTANGHSYKDSALGSRNTNFALLVSHTFPKTFTQPNEYAKEISKRANDLVDGSIMVQRLGDLRKGMSSTEEKIKVNSVVPTCPEAVPSDFSYVLPHITVRSLLDMFEALDKVTPGINHDDTLMYGVEAKFYSARPDFSNEHFETKIKGLYVGGDGAGITRGLAQASACGVHMARDIIAKIGANKSQLEVVCK